MQPIDLKLEREGKSLIVIVTNVSKGPVNVWSTRFSWGYGAYSFHVIESGGREFEIRRKDTAWTVNIPEVVTIDAGGAHAEEFRLGDDTWDLRECRGSDRTAELVAVLEIRDEEMATEHRVLTGRYESNRIALLNLSEATSG